MSSSPKPAELLDPIFLQRLQRLEFRVRQAMGGQQRGDQTIRRRGPGSLFLEHRAYVPGDDPRFLDWNAYLRLGDLVIKEYQAEISPRVVIVLDRSASMGESGGERALFSRRLAAALGVVALGRHASVLLVAVPLQGGRRLFRGVAARRPFLNALAELECGGETEFLPALSRSLGSWSRGGHAFVISDFLHLDGGLPALRLFAAKRYQTTALHLWRREDLRAPLRGRVEFVDVETGRRRRERIVPAMAKAYRAELRKHFEEMERGCIRFGVAYRHLDLRSSVEEAVLQLVRSGLLVQ